jgi:hypothetical protein
MSDSERDAWLREALRHAPDAAAAPPRDLSETILAQARAAARVSGAPARTARRRNPFLALWDWLARPPVAAGFASIMAATLVGVMWWGRPMDESLPPRSDVAFLRKQQSPPQADVGSATQYDGRFNRDAQENRAIVRESRAPAATAPAAPPAPSVGAIAPAPQPARQQPNEDRMLLNDKTPANAAKVMTPQAATPPPPPSTVAVEAKEQQRKLEAANDAALADSAAAKPAPLPRSDERATAAAATPAKKLDSDAKDGKASDRVPGAADALAARDAALAKSKLAAAPPAVPTEVLRSEPPAAFGRERANELARTSPSVVAEGEAAKRPPAGAMSQATPAPAATMQAAAPAAAPPALGDSASASVESHEKQASAFKPSQQAQGEVALARRQGAGATPLAPIVAAIASDPSRWSRSTAAGSVVALEPGWRDWLAQLDAAARGRWQPSGATQESERDGDMMLRLVDGGRATAVVRLDGTTVRVDAIDRGERWQATLPPAAAERLRAVAGRLGR